MLFMRYRLSVLNIVTGLYLFGCIVFTIFNYEEMASGEGWGVIYMIALASVGMVGLIVDVILQQIIHDRKKLNIVGAILAFMAAFYLLFIN